MNTQPITRWVPAIGRWDFEQPGRAIYLGPQKEQVRPFGICLSGNRFFGGYAGVTVQLQADASGQVQEDASGRLLWVPLMEKC
jgi:hypothetical protein